MHSNMTRLFLLIGVSMVLAASAVQAHHAFAAEFDVNKPVKLTGTVSKVEWINPHTWIHIDVKNQDGSSTTWAIEAGTPNTIFRRGVTKNSLKIGTELVVTGFQEKAGRNRANGQNITFSDGRSFLIGAQSGTEAPQK